MGLVMHVAHGEREREGGRDVVRGGPDGVGIMVEGVGDDHQPCLHMRVDNKSRRRGAGAQLGNDVVDCWGCRGRATIRQWLASGNSDHVCLGGQGEGDHHSRLAGPAQGFI